MEGIKCLKFSNEKKKIFVRCQNGGGVVGGGVVVIISCTLALHSSVFSTCSPQSEPSTIISTTLITTNMPMISQIHQYLLQQSQSSRGPYI